jgi:tetratricopeptide (TPR) repeat protein
MWKSVKFIFAYCLSQLNFQLAFASTLQIRGGASKAISLDSDTVRELLTKANNRHKVAIAVAQEAYWSTDEDHLREVISGNKNDSNFEPYGVGSPSWSIPDFSDTLSEGQCIFVTKGAGGGDGENVMPLFTHQECQKVIQDANHYFQTTNGGEWTVLQSGRFPVCGFWIKEIPAVHAWFNSMLEERLFPSLARLFPDFCNSISDLVCDNAYLFKYTPETGERTDVHTDSGCLSFTISLNSKEDYEGGGTWFDSLQSTSGPVEGCIINMDVGHVTFRPGGLRHRGDTVTKGERYIIGGFVMHKNKIEHVRMLTGLGSDLTQQKRYNEAEEAFKGAIYLNSRFDAAYINLANLYTKMGKEKEAIEVLEEARRVNNMNGEASYSLGVLMKNKGDVKRARECFDDCLLADKFDVEAMMGNAIICSQLGDTQGEKDWFAKVISTPGAKKATVASAYTNLGVILGESGDKEGELAMYQKAIELTPNHFHAQHSSALCYGEKREWEASKRHFYMALSSAPNEEKKAIVLQDMYRVAVMKINADPATKSKTREEVIEMFKSVMGEENYVELTSILSKR